MKGAKHLIFLSRSAAKTPGNTAFIQNLKTKYNVNAVAYNCDIADRDSLKAVLTECAKDMPPIKGAVTGAMVLVVSVVFAAGLLSKTLHSLLFLVYMLII